MMKRIKVPVAAGVKAVAAEQLAADCPARLRPRRSLSRTGTLTAINRASTAGPSDSSAEAGASWPRAANCAGRSRHAPGRLPPRASTSLPSPPSSSTSVRRRERRAPRVEWLRSRLRAIMFWGFRIAGLGAALASSSRPSSMQHRARRSTPWFSGATRASSSLICFASAPKSRVSRSRWLSFRGLGCPHRIIPAPYNR